MFTLSTSICSKTFFSKVIHPPVTQWIVQWRITTPHEGKSHHNTAIYLLQRKEKGLLGGKRHQMTLKIKVRLICYTSIIYIWSWNTVISLHVSPLSRSWGLRQEMEKSWFSCNGYLIWAPVGALNIWNQYQYFWLSYGVPWLHTLCDDTWGFVSGLYTKQPKLQALLWVFHSDVSKGFSIYSRDGDRYVSFCLISDS